MRGIDFAGEIEANIASGEDLDDVAVMIDIVAARKAEGREANENDYFFAAAVLCILLRPVKPEAYRQEVTRMRQSFGGISRDKDKQDWFRHSLTNQLLEAKDVESAVHMSAEMLFAPVVVGAGV